MRGFAKLPNVQSVAWWMPTLEVALSNNAWPGRGRAVAADIVR